MNDGFGIGITGISAGQTSADVAANNLANVNTPGFKPAAAVSAELPGGGVEISSVGRAMSQGALQPTGNPLDLAIEGEGFLAFKDAAGALSYSRSGAVRPDGAGFLVDARGRRLQGLAGDLQATGTGPVTVGPHGELTETAADGTTRSLGTVAVARFANPGGLEAAGESQFRAGANSGPAAAGTPGTGARGTLRAGFLEMSGTDIAREMVGLITSEKQVAVNVATIRTKDQMLGEILDLKK